MMSAQQQQPSPPGGEVKQKRLEPLDAATVRCPKCNHFIGEVLLQPGTAVRLRCHCNVEFWVFVVSRCEV